MVYFAYGFPSAYRLYSPEYLGHEADNERFSSLGGESSLVPSSTTSGAPDDGVPPSVREDYGTVVCIGSMDDVLVVVTRSHVVVWSGGQDRFVLGACAVVEDLGKDGIVQAVVSENNKNKVAGGRVALVTRSGRVMVVGYDASQAARPGWWDGGLLEDSHPKLKFYSPYSVRVVFEETILNNDEDDGSVGVVGMCEDGECFSIVYQSGDFVTYSWEGSLLNRHSPLEAGYSDMEKGGACVRHIEYSKGIDKMVVVFDSGKVVVLSLCDQEKKGLLGFCSDTAPQLDCVVVYNNTNENSRVTMASFHPYGYYVAIGFEQSYAMLVDLCYTTRRFNVKTLSLSSWGYSGRDLGAVSALAWSFDGKAIAIGYEKKGLSTWSAQGCRLFCTLPTAYKDSIPPMSHFSPRSIAAMETFMSTGDNVMHEDSASDIGLFIQHGISQVSWSRDGGHMLIHEKDSLVLYDIMFARCSSNHTVRTSEAPMHRNSVSMVDPRKPSFSLVGSDRLILINSRPRSMNNHNNHSDGSHVNHQKYGGGGSRMLHVSIRESLEYLDVPQLATQHIRVPQQYLDTAFPIMKAIMSPSRTDIVVAGRHGLGVYHVLLKKWRLIGDVTQDKAIRAHHISWIQDDVVVVCGCIQGSKSKQLPDCEMALWFFPKGHLDASSVLGFQKLDSTPVYVTSCNGRIIIIFDDGEVHIIKYIIKRSNNVPNTIEKIETEVEYSFDLPNNLRKNIQSVSLMKKREVDGVWCITLAETGELGCVDLQNQTYTLLSKDIENYWVPQEDIGRHSGDGTKFELPWWTYGRNGMKMWFDNQILGPNSDDMIAADPELEFDAEVLPIGISLDEVSIIGLMHRMHKKHQFLSSACSVEFSPRPESQPVLACLLRRLLRQDRFQDALELADLYASRPHFTRSLEWLLFTALDANSKQQKDKGLSTKESGTELTRTAELISQFPQSSELVVSVARKTDAELWPPLFDASGSPVLICESLLRDGALQHASCCLLIISEFVGSSESARLALRTLKSALAVSNYDLCGDILRFLAPEDHVRRNDTLSSDEKQTNQGDNNGYVQWLWNMIAPQEADSLAGERSQSKDENEHESLTKLLHLSSSLDINQIQEVPYQNFDSLVNAWRALAKQAWRLLDSGSVRELIALDNAMRGLHGGLSALFDTTKHLHSCSLGHTTPSASLIASALFIASNEMASASEAELECMPCLLQSMLDAGNVNYAIALAIVATDVHVMRDFAEKHMKTWETLETLVSNDVHLCSFSSVLAVASGGKTLARTITI